MIRTYSWPTPNGHKVHIMLYECGLEHEVIPIFSTDSIACRMSATGVAVTVWSMPTPCQPILT